MREKGAWYIETSSGSIYYYHVKFDVAERMARKIERERGLPEFSLMVRWYDDWQR